MISMTKSDDFMATAQGKRPAAGVLYFTNSKKNYNFRGLIPTPWTNQSEILSLQCVASQHGKTPKIDL